MEKYAIYFMQLHERIKKRNTGSVAELAEKMDVSERTVKRAIQTMRDVFKAPYCLLPAGKVVCVFESRNSAI